MSPLLDVEGLHVRIPLKQGMLHPVRGIGFNVSRGETLCIVGESGCGKSLTSLSLMGLLPRRARITATRLRFAGTDLLGLNEDALSELRGNRMAMIFQEPMTSLNPAYSIGNQLEEIYLRHRKASRSEARERAIFLLEKVGITAAASRLSQYPHQLSGGLRQRIMIAMALMCGPELIIADEPTTALDVTVQAQILRLLKDLLRELDMGLILITHDLGVVARIADRVAVMYAGQIVESGSVIEIFERPRHPYMQALLRCVPIPGRTPPGASLGSIPGMVPALYEGTKGCAFRNRCDYAAEPCASDPVPVHANRGSTWRCILSEDESLIHTSKAARSAETAAS